MRTVILLTLSNIFMTFAWYGHLKHLDSPLWKVIIVSWLIAGLEYLFQVPANRLGAESGWNGFQLKITQEVITIMVFVVFATFYLKERPGWNHVAAFVCLVVAVFLVFAPRKWTGAKPVAGIAQSTGGTAHPERPARHL